MKMTQCTKWDADEQCYTDGEFGLKKTTKQTKCMCHTLKRMMQCSWRICEKKNKKNFRIYTIDF